MKYKTILNRTITKKKDKEMKVDNNIKTTMKCETTYVYGSLKMMRT